MRLGILKISIAPKSAEQVNVEHTRKLAYGYLDLAR